MRAQFVAKTLLVPELNTYREAKCKAEQLDQYKGNQPVQTAPD